MSISYFEEAKVEGMYDNELDTSLCSNSELNLSMSESLSVNDVGVGGSIDWFNKHINSYYESNLKIPHLNVNRIYGKSVEVLELLNQCRFDILFFGESKIDDSVSNNLISRPQYRIIRKDRKRGAGGMLVYIRSTTTAYRGVKLEPVGVESICLDVKGSQNVWFLICASYRSPSKCKIRDFITSCTTAAKHMYTKRKGIIFIGDFNMNMLSRKHNTPNYELSDFCDEFCLSNVIDKPTRVIDTTCSLIDAILVSHADRLSTSGNLHFGVSDHDLIYVIWKQRLPKPKTKTIELRTTTNLDVNSFVKDLEEIPWDSAYAYDNIDDIWHHWVALFNQILDKHVPLVQKKIANRQIPWITAQIRKEIRKKTPLYKKFRKNTTNMNWIKYEEQRNIVTSLKRNMLQTNLYIIIFVDFRAVLAHQHNL